MTMQTLDIAPSVGGITAGAHCRAPLDDVSGVCGRFLSDEASVRAGIGPDCWQRLFGAPRRPGRRYPPGEEQAALPIDVPDAPIPEPADVDPAGWPWRVVAGQIVCAQPGCTAVLADAGPWTVAPRLKAQVPLSTARWRGSS